MTGQGARFKAAGYPRLKPFIKIHEKPMIWWIVKMFPGDAANMRPLRNKDLPMAVKKP